MKHKSFYVEVLRPEISELLCKLAKEAGLNQHGEIDYTDLNFVVETGDDFFTMNGDPMLTEIPIKRAIDYFTSLKAPVFNEGDWIIYWADIEAPSIERVIEVVDDRISVDGGGYILNSDFNEIQLRHAADDEIEKYLFAEFERRGYIGSQIKFLDGGEAVLRGSKLVYDRSTDSLFATDIDKPRDIIYQSGKWAEIIPQQNDFNLGSEIESMLTSLNKIRENMLTDQNS